MADAFKPFKSLSLGQGDFGCEVFAVRYPVIVQNIARFIGNSGFRGHVIFITTPPGTRGCDQVASPMAPSPVVTEPPLSKELGAPYYYEQIKNAEIIWRTAFQKWAPNVKLSILNITHISETRADALIPDADESGPTGKRHMKRGECEAFCYPGLPIVWSEMLLRLLEQYHFHN